MHSEFGTEWSAEPQWKVTYVARRVTPSGTVVRDRGFPPASWYLAPWEADTVLAENMDFGLLVDREDPRIPRSVASHTGPAVVTLTCTRCDFTADSPSAFAAEHRPCEVPSTPRQTVPETSPSRHRADPSCRDAWMAAAQTGTLIEGIDPGWPSRDTESFDSWTVQLSFDVDAYSRDHAEQIAHLLATITGGRVSGLS